MIECHECLLSNGNETVSCRSCGKSFHTSCVNATNKKDFGCSHCFTRPRTRSASTHAMMSSTSVTPTTRNVPAIVIGRAVEEPGITPDQAVEPRHVPVSVIDRAVENAAAEIARPSSSGMQSRGNISRAQSVGSVRSKGSISERKAQIEQRLREEQETADRIMAIQLANADTKIKNVRKAHEDMDQLFCEGDGESSLCLSERSVREWVNQIIPNQDQVPQNVNRSVTIDTSRAINNITEAQTSEEFRQNISRGVDINNSSISGNRHYRKIPDLPRFGGLAKEWPEFICSYQETTKEFGITDLENLGRIRKSLYGKALRLVEGSLLHSSAVIDVLDTLRDNFGDPELIIEFLEIELLTIPKVEDNLCNLGQMSAKTSHWVNAIKACGMLNHLKNFSLLRKLQTKLPIFLGLSWAKQKGKYPDYDMELFEKFLRKQNSLAMKAGFINQVKMRVPEKFEKTARTMTVEMVENRNRNCLICDDFHKLEHCKKFQIMEPMERFEVVQKHKLCWRCLKKHPQRCLVQQVCDMDGCQRRHHHLLHRALTAMYANKCENSEVVALTKSPRRTLFKIVPVILRNENIMIKTFAFLDEGSSVSLIEKELANELNVTGKVEPLKIKWTGPTTKTEKESQNIELFIAGMKGATEYKIRNIHTVQDLDLPLQSINKTELTSCRYLDNVPLEYYSNAKPKILIGVKEAFLGLPLEIKQGKKEEPIAIRTRLGWILYGGGNSGTEAVSFNVEVCCISSLQSDTHLHEAVKQFFDMESFGVKLTAPVQSKEDKRAIDILENTVKRVNGRYESGLLWAQDRISLPNSQVMCERRAENLEKKLLRDPSLTKRVEEMLKEYMKKDYIQQIEKSECNNSKSWYLPIFTVTNPQKPDKLRIVWDAAASVSGVCLNTFLLKGPDMLVPLPEVLLRFREHEYAVAGDIAEMFHQIRIIEEDQDFQKFIWKKPGSKETQHYRMQVMTFGASCSPSIAQYVKNKNADSFQNMYPNAVIAIKNNTYVDDWLQSFPNIQIAIQTVMEVILVHKNARMEIKKWCSNSPDILKAVGGIQLTKEFDSECKNSRVLGMSWFSKEDTIGYSFNFEQAGINGIIATSAPTKREVLRITMSLFDPLGLVAHIVVQSKILLKAIWKSGCGWDEPINVSLNEEWRRWCLIVPQVNNLRILRWYKIDTDIELHIFVDAGENAFAAAAYLRGTNSEGLNCQLVMAKTRVSPIRAVTIPRLELQAAVLGVRLGVALLKSLTIPVKRKIFWTDSADVLYWINSESRRYRPYVAFRISEILESSKIQEWRWLPSKDNVADEATKFKPTLKQISSCDRWFKGPDFLYLSEESWPQKINLIHEDTTGEEITVSLNIVHVKGQLVPDSTRFSSWERLIRTTAYALRFFFLGKRMLEEKKGLATNSKAKSAFKGVLKFEERQRAIEEIIRQVQGDEFSDVISSLRRDPSTTIERNHKLHQLSPGLDKDGIMHIRGRIQNAELANSLKNPIILPGDIVTIFQEDQPNEWRIGKVVELITGRRVDQVRQVVIKTQRGILTRPAAKVARLDVYSEADQL